MSEFAEWNTLSPAHRLECGQEDLTTMAEITGGLWKAYRSTFDGPVVTDFNPHLNACN